MNERQDRQETQTSRQGTLDWGHNALSRNWGVGGWLGMGKGRSLSLSGSTLKSQGTGRLLS